MGSKQSGRLARAALMTAVAALLVTGCGGGSDGGGGGAATATATAPAVSSTRAVVTEPAEVDDPAGALGDIGQTVRGTPIRAVSWTDANGDNLLVLSSSKRTVKSPYGDGPAVDEQLYADQFATKGGQTRALRHVQDGVRACEFDRLNEFKSESPQVGDADKDGTADVLIGYTLACVSDVSPITLKVLVLEGGEKYILRGETFQSAGSGQGTGLAPLPDAKPDPAVSRWPNELHDLATAAFDRWCIRE